MAFNMKDMDFAGLKNTLEELRTELENDLKKDPKAVADIVPLLTSVARLQKEMPEIKSEKDLNTKKFYQCIPDLAFLMQCLNPGGIEDLDDDEWNEELDRLEFDECDDEECGEDHPPKSR